MDDPKASRMTGRESLWVVAMTLLGAGIRLKGLGVLGLDHFDEGIYAQAATWIFAGGGLRAINPGLVPYAPPGYPAMVGLAFAAIGPSGTAAILVSILGGVLTIPTLAWIARRAFGTGAGAATASLAAMAGPHVVFSRVALTDATFLLAWSLAMAAILRFLERPGIARAVWVGLAVGLAQWVKYNGWMAGAIAVAVVSITLARGRGATLSARRMIGFGVLAAGVAALVYLPWFLFVEGTTGYGGLMRHHGSYVDGPSGWWPNWQQQMAQASALEGVFAVGRSWMGVGLALAWLGAAVGQGRAPGPGTQTGRWVVLMVITLAAASLFAPPNLSWWIALAWAPAILAGRRPGASLVAGWFLVMAATTPLYHPYARLWLPTLAASWVATGGLVAAVLAGASEPSRAAGDAEHRIPGRGHLPRFVVLSAVILACLSPLFLTARVLPVRDLLARSDGVRSFASSLVRAKDGAAPSVIHLYARPPFRFYLAAEGLGPIRIHGDLDSVAATSPGPGAIAVLDAAQGVSEADVDRVVARSGWRVRHRELIPVAIPTVLDVLPGSVYDPDVRPIGLGPSAGAVRDGPRAAVWILERR